MIFNKNLFKVAASTILGISMLTFSACQQETELAPKENARVEVARDANNGTIIPGKYIVVFKSGESTLGVRPDATYEEKVAAAKGQAEQLLGKYGISRDRVERAYGSAIKGFAASLSEEEFSRLSADPAVAYIEPDKVISLGNVSTANVTNVTAIADEIPYGIAKVGYGDGTGKTVWVIDTGVDLDHPDLNVDLARSRTMFTSGKDARSADDGDGHGTHVAGTIAAKLNGIGVLGVAYNATVVGVKVLDSRGSGTVSTVVGGVDYVAANAKVGEVANMSLGGGASTAIDNAVINAANKGIKMVIAAGNSSASATTSSPARVNGPNIFTISAVDANNRFASFSNFGNPPVDFAAPGVNIKSTWIGGGYNTISGTSMAAPHVAGILTLGNINISGYATNDPDGNADPIASR